MIYHVGLPEDNTSLFMNCCLLSMNPCNDQFLIITAAVVRTLPVLYPFESR